MFKAENPEIIKSIDDLKTHIVGKSYQRIGIDGVFGAGKTYVAKHISDALGIRAVRLDSYLKKTHQGYLNDLNYVSLEADLSKGPFIIAGICLLEALEKVDHDLDFLIYIKDFSIHGWIDKEKLEVTPGTVNRILDETLYNQKLVTSYPLEDVGLIGEVIQYHAMHRPQDQANFVFHNMKPEDL